MCRKETSPQAILDSVHPERREAIEHGAYPRFVYSFSSRGFPDLPQRLRVGIDLVPAYLLSLYDLRYNLNEVGGVVSGVIGTAKPRILDSGNYETYQCPEASDPTPPGIQPWSPDLYVDSANQYLSHGDVLVSWDTHSIPVKDQITTALRVNERIRAGDVKLDFLLHIRDEEPEAVADLLAPYHRMLAAVGIVEKEITPWFRAVEYIWRLRHALDERLDRYVPIHVFGCLDPATIPYLFFAGADIFDGLTWMRYFLTTEHAFYVREFEYHTPIDVLSDLACARVHLLTHNVEVLEKLRVNLQYTVLAGDASLFSDHLDRMKAVLPE